MSNITHIGRNFSDKNSDAKELIELFTGLPNGHTKLCIEQALPV